MIIKKLKQKLNKIKICAVFTTICFMVSTLGANLYATPIAENITKKYEDVFNKIACINSQYGKITSYTDAKSDITIINIQDLHCHPQTQRNISNIIGEIADKYNLTKIYVEGGYGDIDTSWLNRIKDNNIRKQAIERLVEKGILTGSEYYKLTSNNESIELKGIDEEDIHKDNVKRLSWIISQQNKYKETIEKITKEINILENIYINNRNKKFSESIEKYLNNKTDTKKFYRKLVKYVKDINNNPQKYNNITVIRLEDYPNINKFLSMVTDSNTINIKKVKTELQELILLLKNKLPFSVYSSLLKETNNFTDNQKSLELINLLCEKENIDLNNNFKEIVKLSNLNLNNKNFNPIELVQEERQLITEIRKALSYNNEEYEITFASDFVSYFQNYLEYKLTDTDWKYFDNYYKQFRQIYSKYAAIDRIKDIEQDFAEINKYYTINDRRNDIFVENLLKDETINLIESIKLRSDEKILKDSKEVIIAVTGGFHSKELEELLSKKGINTIIITPIINESTKQANKQYIDLIKEQSKINSQALAYTIASCIKDIDKQKLLLSIAKDIVGKNIQELEKLLGKQIDLSLLEESATIDEKSKSNIRTVLETTIEQVLKNVPQEGMKGIILPNIDEIMLDLAQVLVNNGIYFSKGTIFEIENSGINGKDLKGIPAEIYSRMLPSLQKALLAVAVDKIEDNTNNEPPQLTMTFLKKILDKTSLKRNIKIKIAAIIEAPIIILGLIFPSINNWFLKQHKVEDIIDKIIITSELETLGDNIKNVYFNSFIKIKETVKIPFVRTVIAFSISIVKAFKANIEVHIDFNTISYATQSYQDLIEFDVKYAKFFQDTNFTSKQEKQIIRIILNLKDKFNINNSSKSYSSNEITTMLQQFEAFEIMFFKKNKKPLYINSIINTPSDLQKINDLLKELFSSKIFNIETEYNMLALKIFKNDVFNKLINQSSIEYGKQSVTQKYFIAIAVARYIEKVLNGNPVKSQNFDEIVRAATETYIEIIEHNENKTVIDENTKIIAISAQSDDIQQFNNNGIKKLLQKLNIPENGENRIFLSSDMESAQAMKQRFLDMIANLNANDKQVFISFDGHGFERTLILNSFVNITNEELFTALKKAQEKGFDLNNLTINLSSCESWFFANYLYNQFDNLYKKLEQKKKLPSKSYPTIWTAAGHETKYGYTDNYYSLSTPLFDDNGEINMDTDLNTVQVGNEWNAVLLMLSYRQQTSLKIKDILKSTLEANKVNFTLFISDKNIEQICNKSAKKILELNSYNDDIKEIKQQDIKGIKSFINKLFYLLIKINDFSSSKLLYTRTEQKLNFNMGYFELSIFSELKNKNKLFALLYNTAYIWEEILFRFIPAILFVTAISLPTISFVTIPVSLIFFVISQNQFIKAHNVSAWIAENNFNWSTKNIFEAILFNTFPSKELKEQFKQFEKQRRIKEQNVLITLPTILLSIPYIYSILFAPSMPVIMLATVIGITLHKFFNSSLKNKLNIFENEFQSNKTGNINYEQIENMDLKDKTDFQFINHMLASDEYNTNLGNMIIEKIDFTDESQLNLLYKLRFVNDDILAKILQKSNINDIKHLSLILELIPRAGYLLSFQNVFTQIIKNINLKDTETLEVFYKFVVNNNHSLDENNIHLLMEKLDLNTDEHIKLLELIVKNNVINVELIFNILLNNKINLNDKRYDKFFKTIIDKLLSKYATYRDAKKYFKSNVLNLPANTIQGKYAFSMLINLLNSDLVAHQNKYLKMTNGYIVLKVNENGHDPIFSGIKDFAQEMSVQQDLFDNELKTKFNKLMRDIVFFEKMETKTAKRVYTNKYKVTDSLSDNVTIEEFCKEKGLSLIKQTPGIFFDSSRYVFTNILGLLSQKVLNIKTKKHNGTYIMTGTSVDTIILNDTIKKFDAYMKLLDENMYVLNKFAELDNFSSQFDDVVYHINLMIDCLEQINISAASVFKKILNKLLADIRNNKTTITEQKQLIEYSSTNNLYDNITTINTLINRIHQQANFSFVTKIMGTIEDYENAGYNVLISKNDNLISVYNLSSTNLSPQIIRFLSELAENPDFSTDVKTPIFIKDNIFLWVASLGAHSVRILIDFNEDSKSILIDFHEGIIDKGSTIRIGILSNILRSAGFNVQISTQKFTDETLPVGIVATIDKDTGLTSNTDFNNLAKQAAILFNNAASLNNLIHNKIQIKQNINVAKLEIMDIYTRFFSIGLIKNNFVTTTVNSRRKLNKILKSLDLPLIPKTETGFWTFLKIWIFKIPIKTYGQKTIDKYINKPIEQSFAQGYLKINKNGILERDKNYNPLSSMTDKLNEMLNLKPGNIIETEMLNQGALISQIPQKDLNLTTVGQIGNYVLKTGYIKLIDGKFVALTVLVDNKNGIIRYTSTELVGLPEQMNNNLERIKLNSKQLQQILENEGYKINPIETLTNLEILNYRKKLQEHIINNNTPIAYGTLISTPKQTKSTNIFGIINGKDKKSVYIDKYASPENVSMAAQCQISLFTGGSYSSHAGIVLREYKKTAMIVNNSQIIDKKMKIKFYQPQGTVQKQNNLEVQKIEETEIELQPNDIISIDTQNNKLLLFQNKKFTNIFGANILFELQKYINSRNIAKIKQLLNKYKGNKLIEQIIEYIYYQSEEKIWLKEILPERIKSQTNNQSLKTEKTSRNIVKKIINITNYVKHTSKNNVYVFGEQDSLDSTKVGTKSANQSKLFLILEQLKKDTGIKNVAVPNGMVISSDILEKLLGKEYIELYQQLESVIKNDLFDSEQKFVYVQDITEQIKDLIKNIPEENIIKYIGKENLEIFKNKLTIVRSSGVGEDSKEFSAAGIAESFGSVTNENIPKVIKDTLLSFFSYRAIDYMSKSANIIKPAVLIEEWIDADKSGIMMSEDSNGNRIIQVINGQGEDIVSGRITPYSFTIDIKTGKKIDGNYTNEKTVTNENLEKLIKIMEWLEQVEGVPVDIEFLIKDNIIYIVQVRPITTIDKKENVVQISPQKNKINIKKKLSIFGNLKETGRPIFKILDFTAPIWEEVLFRAIPTITAFAIISLPFSYFLTIPISLIIFTLSQRQFVKAHIITDWLKTKDYEWLENLSLTTILKISLFGVFPYKELKNEFNKYSKNEQTFQYKNTLITPTIFLSEIYIIISLLSSINPVLLATLLAIIFHFIGNSNIELFGILKPINIKTKIKETGVDENFISFAKDSGADFISIYDLTSKIKQLKKHNTHEYIPVTKYINPLHFRYWQQQQKVVADSVGFSLGLTTVSISNNNKNKANLIQPISETNSLISWERGYDYFYGNSYIDERVVQVEEYVQTIIDSCIKYNKHIFFFLPDNFMNFDTKTKREFDYIQNLLTNNPELSSYFTFVVGVYDFIEVNNDSVFQKYFNEKDIYKTLKKLLLVPNLFMKKDSKIISNINNNIVIIKFIKNLFNLSLDSILKTIKILTILKFSKKQNIIKNIEAVKKLTKDIKQNNKKQVCFICTANMNRSAVSHLLFEDRLLKLGVNNINVVSAGLLPISQKNTNDNLVLSQEYQKLLDKFNVNSDLIANFRSEEISQKHIDSDYFIVASQKHKSFLIENFNIDSDKIILYSDIDPELQNDSLPDPQKLKISKIKMIKLIKNIFYYLFNVILEEDIKNFANIILNKNTNVIKLFIAEYKSIKANEIENLIENMEQNNKQIYITDNIEQLKDQFLLINTGIKVEGTSIYRVKIGNLLIYGAKNKSTLKVIKSLNDSEQLKKDIKSLFSIKDEIEIEGVILTNNNGININEEGLLEIGETEFQGKTPQQIKEFITSTLEVKRALGIMYGQKTIIDLKKLSGNALIKAIENGRARKVITEEQFNKLQLSKEKISELKEQGIEIYIASNEIKNNLMEIGISGQIIRENGKPYIYDYYNMDKTELDEIINQKELAELENKLLNSDKLIMIDIEILRKNFQGSNPIESLSKFGALTGKIKITMGFGNIRIQDIENVGYNINFDKIPEISQTDIQKLIKATNKEKIINIIGKDNEFAIILTNLKDENVHIFKELIIERILMKKILTDTATAIEGIQLQDKNLEKLLGKMLLRQLNYIDKETIKEELISERQLIKILEQLKESDLKQKDNKNDSQEQQVLVNTIIQLILYDGQRVKGKQLQEQTAVSNISNYRAMLAAA